MLECSLIIPAYNEARRLPLFLPSARHHLDRRFAGCYEVIVVDDGGQDDSLSLLELAGRRWPQLSWLRHEQNRGKGAAVRTGILAAGATYF